jgi:hypothetical protein
VILPGSVISTVILAATSFSIHFIFSRKV